MIKGMMHENNVKMEHKRSLYIIGLLIHDKTCARLAGLKFGVRTDGGNLGRTRFGCIAWWHSIYRQATP